MTPNHCQLVKAKTLLISTGIIFYLLTGCRVADFPFSVPNRSVQKTDRLSLLWVKEIDILDPHTAGWSYLFTPDNQSVVFWYPSIDSLVALDLVTGDTLWETKVPDHSVMRLHNGKFFVPSYEWLNLLEDAPIRNNQVLPDCSWGGTASLLTYDSNTGQQLWGYVYHGVNDYDIFFEDTNVYLTGSNDHGVSESIAQIDDSSGELISLECNKWPAKKSIPSPPDDEGDNPFLYRVVFDESDLRAGGSLLFFVPEGNRLNILIGNTKEVLGYIDFDGFELNPYHIDLAVRKDIAAIYLNDSKQLLSIQLPISVDQLSPSESSDICTPCGSE
jgi:hypothetical protein